MTITYIYSILALFGSAIMVVSVIATSYLLQKRKGKSKIIRLEIAGWQQKGENSRVNNHNKNFFSRISHSPS